MKAKKEYLILLAVIVALSVYLIGYDPDRSHYTLPDLPRVAESDLNRIEIATAEHTISLKQKDNAWYIGPDEFPADSAKVENMLKVIGDLTLTALVSESKVYDRYDLGSAQKITVTAWSSDQKKRQFEVGKAASSYRHTFVKVDGDANVYHARGSFRDTFDQDADDLRDKAVLSIDPESVNRLRLQKGDESVELTRAEAVATESDQKKATDVTAPATDTSWTRSDGDATDEASVKKLLGALRSLTCDAYIPDKTKADLTSPEYHLIIGGSNEASLSIFSPENDRYPAVTSQSDYPFYLTDSTVKRITETCDQILDLPEPEIEKEAEPDPADQPVEGKTD